MTLNVQKLMKEFEIIGFLKFVVFVQEKILLYKTKFSSFFLLFFIPIILFKIPPIIIAANKKDLSKNLKDSYFEDTQAKLLQNFHVCIFKIHFFAN